MGYLVNIPWITLSFVNQQRSLLPSRIDILTIRLTYSQFTISLQPA